MPAERKMIVLCKLKEIEYSLAIGQESVTNNV